jgi:hypothetical protein
MENNLNSWKFYKKGPGVNVSVTLTLYKDFTFVEHTMAMSCIDRSSSTNTISGIFMMDKNELFLKPKKLLFFDFQGNYTKIEGTDSILKANILFIKEYQIVKYQDLIVLLNDSIPAYNYTNDFIYIANAMNKKDTNVNIDDIWKNKDENSITVGKDIANSFPFPWNEYILNKPIVGKVIKTKIVNKEDKKLYKYLDNESKYLYTLDVGEDSGIRKGMKLYAKGKNNCSCELIIFEIAKKNSLGFVRQWQEDNCKKIDEFSTKESN